MNVDKDGLVNGKKYFKDIYDIRHLLADVVEIYPWSEEGERSNRVELSDGKIVEVSSKTMDFIKDAMDDLTVED